MQGYPVSLATRNTNKNRSENSAHTTIAEIQRTAPRRVRAGVSRWNCRTLLVAISPSGDYCVTAKEHPPPGHGHSALVFLGRAPGMWGECVSRHTLFY